MAGIIAQTVMLLNIPMMNALSAWLPKFNDEIKKYSRQRIDMLDSFIQGIKAIKVYN